MLLCIRKMKDRNNRRWKSSRSVCWSGVEVIEAGESGEAGVNEEEQQKESVGAKEGSTGRRYRSVRLELLIGGPKRGGNAEGHEN